ncbi:MAG: universal stress protein [Bdellovibrionia bacterium]
MKDTTAIDRIIWAVDPLQECPEIETRCFETIQALIAGSPSIEVEPACVLPPYHINPPFEVIYPPFPYIGEEVVESLRIRLKGFPLPKFSLPKILGEPVVSTGGAVRELSKYAEERDANLIVVGTHCRKGISRLFLGSFAESLLLNSRTPLLMVGAHTAQVTKFESIFFPTDFGKTSELVFSQVLELSKSLNLKLYIYHLVPKPIIFSTRLAQSLDLPSIMKEEKNRTREALVKYLELAKKSAVKAESMFEESESSESEAILAAARARSCDIIAMAAQSSALRSAIVGSTTRQVVRGASCPVWVLHARAIAEQKGFDETEEDAMSDLADRKRTRKLA